MVNIRTKLSKVRGISAMSFTLRVRMIAVRSRARKRAYEATVYCVTN